MIQMSTLEMGDLIDAMQFIIETGDDVPVSRAELSSVASAVSRILEHLKFDS